MILRRALLMVLLAAVVSSAVFLVYARHLNREYFVALERLNAERDELNIEWGQLQLEQATWADGNRIEQIATRDLDMVFPESREIQVVRP